MNPPFLFRLYRAITPVIAAFAARGLRRKLDLHGVPQARFLEKKGLPSVARPAGRVIWIHGASIGETRSAQPLIEAFITIDNKHNTGLEEGSASEPDLGPDLGLSIILTTSTASAAKLLSSNATGQVYTQFAPLDTAKAVTKFLDYWKPERAITLDSEIWPVTFDLLAQRHIPTALVNARLSRRAQENWNRAPKSAAYVLRGLDFVHCQDASTQAFFKQIGVTRTQLGPNLKAFVKQSAIDPASLDSAKSKLSDRPVWLAASTHAGEEEIVLKAHKRLLSAHPTLQLILMPRHPERAGDILELAERLGLSAKRRSEGAEPGGTTQLYIADSFGEAALWYRLCPIVFMGGSLSDVGGHTPYEAALEHSALIHGPRYRNFEAVYDAFKATKASIQIQTVSELASTLETLINNHDLQKEQAARAEAMIPKDHSALQGLTKQLLRAQPHLFGHQN